MVLASHAVHHLAARADQQDVGCLQCTGELGPFGQEAISGVYGVGAGRARDLDDRLDVEITRHLDGTSRAGDVGGLAVGFGEDGDGLDAEPVGGADDPQRDLARVGDQEGFHRRTHILKIP